jgi:Sulfotransferase family
MDAAPHRDVIAEVEPAAMPLFVLGGHRGGTTLVQRLLNSYDDVTIWGEHEGVLTQIADAYFRGLESRQLFRDVRASGASDPRTDWQAWMTGVDAADWEATFRRLVTGLFPAANGARHWGFKEIRYGTTAGDRAIELLARLFPRARVAFVVRNPFNMLASAHSRPEGPRALADVVRICGRIARRFGTFLDWHASRRLESYWIVYEDLLREAGDVHRLLAALGHAMGPAQRDVLAAEGSARGSSFHDADVNTRWRRLPSAWLAVARHALAPTATALGYPVPPLSPFWRLAGPVLWRRGGGTAMPVVARTPVRPA